MAQPSGPTRLGKRRFWKYPLAMSWLRGLGAVCVCAVIGSSAAANAGTEARVVTYRYAVKITGHTAVYSRVSGGTASETVAWTTTVPTVRLVVRPTGAYGKVPAGYSLQVQGNALGHAEISLHLLRKGMYENCDWSATYGRDVKMMADGYPWLATGSRYHLLIFDTWAPGRIPIEPDAQAQCQAGDLDTTVGVKSATPKLEGATGLQRAFTNVWKEFRAPQPRKHLSAPLAAFVKGRNVTLRVSGTTANDYVDRGSASVTLTFTRLR